MSVFSPMPCGKGNLAFFVVAAILFVGSNQQSLGSEGRPNVQCDSEAGGLVCRSEAATFIWCKSAADLNALEANLRQDPSRKSNVIAEATLRGQCGTTGGIAMNVMNRPERTLEGVLHPVVSTNFFGPPLNQDRKPSTDAAAATKPLAKIDRKSWPDTKIACDFETAAKFERYPNIVVNDEIQWAIQDKKCELLKPDTTVDTEATSTKGVVYATLDGKHLGYIPIDMFVSEAVERNLDRAARATFEPRYDGPRRVGECRATTIRTIDHRLGSPGSGSKLEMADGGRQVGYEDIPAVHRSRPGDAVMVCVVRIGPDCPKDTGFTYKTTNQRTGKSWVLYSSTKECG